MENPASLEKISGAGILLVANPGIFPLTLLELFLSNHFRVKVITENVRDWKEISGRLSKNDRYLISDIKSGVDFVSETSIYIDDGIHRKENGNLAHSFLKLLRENGLLRNTRFLLCFNERDRGALGRLTKVLSREKVIFVKDMFGPGILEKGVSVPSDLLIEAILKKELILPRNDLMINPVFSESVAKEIVKFSTVALKEDNVVIAGKGITVKDFSFKLLKFIKDCNLKIGDYVVKEEKLSGNEKLIDDDLEDGIDRTLVWYGLHLFEKSNDSKVKKIGILHFFYDLDDQLSLTAKKIKKAIGFVVKPITILGGLIKGLKIPGVKWVKPITKVLTLSLLITVFPILILAASLLFIVTAQEAIKLGDRGVANKLLRIGTFTSNLSEKLFLTYSYFPGFSQDYLYMKNLAEDVDHVANIGTTLTDISIAASNLSKKMLGERDYSVSDYAKTIDVEIDKLYRQASFFEGDIKKQGVWHFAETASLLRKFDLEEKRSQLYGVKKIVDSLPSILSEKGEKNYLLLFQNNMELRPTGGFIGSFAIVKFKEGKLSDLNVMDVYTADGQLKGHVEPPSPIRDYLNQANWYLRDSNWDPEFTTSAQRAEWFINKELDIAVDGVIAVDLNFIKDIVAATGPVKISDFDRVVNKDNLYEIVQYEAEKDFFPGSQRKASFLTALSKELILNFSQGKTKNLLGLAGAFYNNLEEGHIQIFLHDTKAQEGITDLGWAGKIDPPDCLLNNCYSDWLGVVEANLGVNKANYFVERKMSFSSYIDRRIVKRRIEINLKSTANPALGERGAYSVYLRLVAPENAEFEDVRIVAKGQERVVRPSVEYIKSRTEAGVFVEVTPSTGVSITFAWKNLVNLDFEREGRYAFYWRKQPGTSEDKVSIEVNLPKGLEVVPSFDPSLTGTGVIGYNLALPRSIEMFFDW